MMEEKKYFLFDYKNKINEITGDRQI
jgi:hypothetical protein